MFKLSRQLDNADNPMLQFKKYDEYVEQNQHLFPKNAYELATSDWYYNFSIHQCPHDGWLEEITIREIHCGERQQKRAITITIKLLAAYHDGYIILNYPLVYGYSFKNNEGDNEHSDWRYDEFRVSDSGHLIHEIEWANGAHWLIEANDIVYTWIPFDFNKL